MKLIVEFEDNCKPKYSLEELKEELWRVIEKELYLKIKTFSLEVTE